MELEITEKNENPLLHRQEIQIAIRHENSSTPKRNEVIKSLSDVLKAKKELIIIEHLKNTYGRSETLGYAKIYSSVDALKKIETKPSIARHKVEEKNGKKSKNDSVTEANNADEKEDLKEDE